MMPLSHVLPIFSDLSRSNVKSYLTLSLHIKVNQQEEKEDKRVEREEGDLEKRSSKASFASKTRRRDQSVRASALYFQSTLSLFTSFSLLGEVGGGGVEGMALGDKLKVEDQKRESSE